MWIIPELILFNVSANDVTVIGNSSSGTND